MTTATKPTLRPVFPLPRARKTALTLLVESAELTKLGRHVAAQDVFDRAMGRVGR